MAYTHTHTNTHPYRLTPSADPHKAPIHTEVSLMGVVPQLTAQLTVTPASAKGATTLMERRIMYTGIYLINIALVGPFAAHR